MSPPRKVLFVMESASRGQAHALLGTGRGLAASFAEGALYALTQLERDLPDLLVCDEATADMAGEDLLEILRSDPATAHCPFLLISRERPARFAGPPDLWQAAGLSPQDLIGAVLEQLTRLDSPPPGRPEDGDPSTGHSTPGESPGGLPVPDGSADGSEAQLCGQLELIGLFDLLTFLNQMRKSGRLLVQLGDVVAQVVIDAGEVVSAEYGVLSGEEAFFHTFAATEAAPGAPFTFRPLRPGEGLTLTQTLTTPTQQLMLAASVQLDHARAAHG